MAPISFFATVSLLIGVLSHVLVVQKISCNFLIGIFQSAVRLKWHAGNMLKTVIGERGSDYMPPLVGSRCKHGPGKRGPRCVVRK